MDALEPVALAGRLVRVEPLGVRHAAGLAEAADREEVFAWLPYPRPGDEGEARKWIDDALADGYAGRRLAFAVVRLRDGKVIGSTSYWDYDERNRNVEIGSTWLSRALWRSGFNVEVKLLLMTHAFDALGLERVHLRTDVLNRRSRRAIEALGARQEGIHRHEMLRRDGSWRDSVHYSLLRDEWPVSRARLEERLRAAAAQPS